MASTEGSTPPPLHNPKPTPIFRQSFNVSSSTVSVSSHDQHEFERHLSFHDLKSDRRPSISDKLNNQKIRSSSVSIASMSQPQYPAKDNVINSNYTFQSPKKAVNRDSGTPIERDPKPNILKQFDSKSGSPSSAHPSFQLDSSIDLRRASHTGGPNLINATHNLGANVPSFKTHHSPSTSPEPLKVLSSEDDDKIHILIGVTGCISAPKVLLIINKLIELYNSKISIQVILTPAAEYFIKPYLSKFPPSVKIWYNEDEFNLLTKNGNLNIKPENSILHLELKRWTDVMLLAPLSANTLAKIINGLADNLLMNLIRSWNPATTIITVPALSNSMYSHPITSKQFETLKEDFPFMKLLKPSEKVSDNGNISMGGMRDWNDVVDSLIKEIGMDSISEDEDECEEDEDERQEDEDKIIDFTLDDSESNDSDEDSLDSEDTPTRVGSRKVGLDKTKSNAF